MCTAQVGVVCSLKVTKGQCVQIVEVAKWKSGTSECVRKNWEIYYATSELVLPGTDLRYQVTDVETQYRVAASCILALWFP